VFNESWTTVLAENTCAAASSQAATLLTGYRRCRCCLILCAKHLGLRDWRRISPTGFCIPTMTTMKQWSIEDHYAQIQVPVFSLGAWYDIFLGDVKKLCRLKNEAGSEAARRGQRLIIYVGGHAVDGMTRKWARLILEIGCRSISMKRRCAGTTIS